MYKVSLLVDDYLSGLNPIALLTLLLLLLLPVPALLHPHLLPLLMPPDKNAVINKLKSNKTKQ